MKNRKQHGIFIFSGISVFSGFSSVFDFSPYSRSLVVPFPYSHSEKYVR